MPSLKLLRLGHFGINTWDPREWLHVFNAIRDCHDDLQIEFDAVMLNYRGEQSFSYHTSDFAEYLNKKTPNDEDEKEKRSLALYLSGKIGLDHYLRQMLMMDQFGDIS